MKAATPSPTQALASLTAAIADASRALADAVVVAQALAEKMPGSAPHAQATGNGSGQTSESPWMTAAQAANYLGVKVKTLRQWRATGGGPEVHRCGTRALRYRREELDAYLSGKDKP